MDALFHFGTPDTKPYKKKNLSLIPSSFKNNVNSNNFEKEEEPLSPIIYQKKSHFSKEQPLIFSLQLCDNNNNEDETPNDIEDKPISPMSSNFFLKIRKKII